MVIASSSSDQTIKLWKQTNDEATLTLYGHEHVIEVLKFAKGQSKISIHEAKWNKETAILQKANKERQLDDIIKESKEKLAAKQNSIEDPNNNNEVKDELEYIDY